jgi:peptide/nickel transport system substrate-binding protein
MKRRTLLATALAAPAVPPLAAPAIAQPSRPSTLKFIPQANLTALDPIWTTATVTNGHGFYVFDTLYGVDAQLRPHPQMAEGHETSADGRIWRIRLRPGLRFHDNEPVRAQDCIASLQRWAARDPFGQLLAARTDAWVAIDDRTFELRLSRPFPMLLEAISKPDSAVAFIMPERLAKTDPMKQVTEMTGSGPYRFIASEYNSGSRIVYEKFENYSPRNEPPEWTCGGKIAHFQRIEWHVIPDAATAAAAMLSGEMDWWERPHPDLLASLRKSPNIAVQVADPAGRLALLRMNHTQAPFNDPKLRQAVRLAVNQDEHMRAARGDDTTLWHPCRSLFPKGTPFHQDHADLMPADLKAAKAAMKEAAYANQRMVIINPTDFPDIGPLGQVSAELCKSLGFNVDLQEMDWGSVVQRRTKREPVDQGGWSMLHTTTSASSLVSPAVNAYVRGQGPTGWFGWYANPALEDLAAQWLDAPDPAEQLRLAHLIGRRALEDTSTIPVGQFYLQTAFRRRLTGVLQGNSQYPWNVRPV